MNYYPHGVSFFRTRHHESLRRRNFVTRKAKITDPVIEPPNTITLPDPDKITIPQITEGVDDLEAVLDKLRDLTNILSRYNWPVPQYDGDNDFLLANATGTESKLTTVVVGDNYTASVGEFVVFNGDPAIGSKEITLPASPSVDDEVGAYYFADDGATVNPNGGKIEGSTGNYNLGSAVIFKFSGDGDVGWYILGGSA